MDIPIKIIGNKKRIWFQLLAQSPPISQNQMVLNCSPARYMRNETNAEKRELIAIPVNNKVSIEVLSPFRAIEYTIKIVISANKNAKIVTIEMPNRRFKLRIKANEAPKAAPEEMPRMYGLAIGLRNIACIEVPATASADPTRAPRIMRGKRISRIIA